MKFLRNLAHLSLVVGLFVTASSSRGVAQTSVTCKGFTFTDGVVIGNDNGNVITKILNKRVYVERNGALADNLGIYYAMKPGNYSSLNQDQWWGCVNPRDPSVNGSNMLGDQVGDAIPCNGKLITKDRWLNFYRGDDNFRTFNVAKIDKGVLRVHALRKDPNTTPSQSELNLTYADGVRFNIGLLEAGWYNEGHNNDNPNEPTLTKAEIDGCFYKDDVKFADCVSTPVIGTISSISQTGLSFSFTGFTGGIFSKIAWRIIPSVANKANERSGQINSPSAAGTNFSFASLPAGTYTLQVEGGDCGSSVNSKTFVIPSANACSQNPVIGNITPVTQTGLTFTFTGSGLPNLTWRIKPVVANASNERSGKTGAVNNAGVSLTFASLPYGDYNLEIEGGDCTSSTSTKSFKISKPNCSTAPEITGITNISGTGLTLTFSGGGLPNTLAWVIINSANSAVSSGTTASLSTGSVALNFNNLPVGTYTLEIQGGSCASSVSTANFSIPRIPCPSGPTLREVYNKNVSGLTFNFAGNGVHSISWRILSVSGSPLRTSSSDITPTNDRPSISYGALPNNTWYGLEIQGGNTCVSTPSLMLFELGSAGPLPIYIADFAATAKKEGVALSWKVVSEQNGEGFQVLRFDSNAKTPQIIASIPLSDAKIGTYNYLDKNPANGVNYYQLKQIDTDGSFTTSRIINVNFDGVYGMFMAPNPAREFVDVEFESGINGTASFDTYSTAGIKVLNSKHKVKIGQNKIRMNVSNLAEGSYILKMDNGAVSRSLRFLKVQ